MNATPIRPGSNEREELARLLPQPAERDLPSDRHRQLQEFVMNHIQQDLRQATGGPRRSPRRLAYLTSALAAAAVIAAVAAAVGTGVLGDAGTSAIAGGASSAEPAPVSRSGRQILLAAATTAEKLPSDTGAYWYVKVAPTSSRNGEWWQDETWTARDGRTWSRGYYRNPALESASPSVIPDKATQGKVIEQPEPNPFSLGGVNVTIAQLQTLPTEPAALKARIAELVRTSDIRTSGGKPTDAEQQEFVFEGLVSLISLLPAPAPVRAAALRAIALYPNVTDLGAVEGGRGLLISFYPGAQPARLVIDPQTGRLRRTNVLVLSAGGTMGTEEGTYAVTAEWTNTLPR